MVGKDRNMFDKYLLSSKVITYNINYIFKVETYNILL